MTSMSVFYLIKPLVCLVCQLVKKALGHHAVLRKSPTFKILMKQMNKKIISLYENGWQLGLTAGTSFKILVEADNTFMSLPAYLQLSVNK